MIWLRKYLLSVVGAAIICATVKALVGRKSGSGHLIYVISGLFLAITVITPIIKLELPDFSNYMDTVATQSSSAVDAGVLYSEKEIAQLIKDKTEAYILDKAELLGVRLRVNVILTDANPPVPEQVHLSGNISPYAKTQLMQYISEQLGIPEEAQRWS